VWCFLFVFRLPLGLLFKLLPVPREALPQHLPPQEMGGTPAGAVQERLPQGLPARGSRAPSARQSLHLATGGNAQAEPLGTAAPAGTAKAGTTEGGTTESTVKEETAAVSQEATTEPAATQGSSADVPATNGTGINGTSTGGTSAVDAST